MTDSIKQKLCEVLTLCVEVTELGCDCFFDYGGSQNHYSFYRCNGVYSDINGLIFIDTVIDVTDENLDATIAKLQALKAEWTNKGE